MVNASPASWAVRGATFAVWLLAAGSCVYWGLKLTRNPAAPAVPVAARSAAAPDTAAVTRLLGATASGPAAPLTAAAPATGTRFVLVGVVDAVRSRNGTAVIAVDGKPARPFRVGAAVDEQLVVLAVEGRRAELGPAGGPATVTLELPARK